MKSLKGNIRASGPQNTTRPPRPPNSSPTSNPKSGNGKSSSKLRRGSRTRDSAGPGSSCPVGRTLWKLPSGSWGSGLMGHRMGSLCHSLHDALPVIGALGAIEYHDSYDFDNCTYCSVPAWSLGKCPRYGRSLQAECSGSLSPTLGGTFVYLSSLLQSCCTSATRIASFSPCVIHNRSANGSRPRTVTLPRDQASGDKVATIVRHGDLPRILNRGVRLCTTSR